MILTKPDGLEKIKTDIEEIEQTCIPPENMLQALGWTWTELKGVSQNGTSLSTTTEIPPKHVTRNLSEDRWSNENQKTNFEINCEIYLLLKLTENCTIAN